MRSLVFKKQWSFKNANTLLRNNGPLVDTQLSESLKRLVAVNLPQISFQGENCRQWSVVQSPGRRGEWLQLLKPCNRTPKIFIRWSTLTEMFTFKFTWFLRHWKWWCAKWLELCDLKRSSSPPYQYYNYIIFISGFSHSSVSGRGKSVLESGHWRNQPTVGKFRLCTSRMKYI